MKHKCSIFYFSPSPAMMCHHFFKKVCVCVSECKGKRETTCTVRGCCNLFGEQTLSGSDFYAVCVCECVCALQKAPGGAACSHFLLTHRHTQTHMLKEAAARRGNSLVGKTKDHSQLDLVISNKDITDCVCVCVCVCVCGVCGVCASACLCFCMSHISNP